MALLFPTVRAAYWAIVILVACERGQTSGLEKLEDRPAISAQRTVPALPTPGPPPPPPPPVNGPMRPPILLAYFIAEPDDNAWVITVDRRRLSAADAAKVIEHLISKTSYIDGVYGCTTNDRYRILLERGKRRREIVVDCGNVMHEGAQIATLEERTIDYFASLRSAPAAPRTPRRTRSR